MNHHTAESLTAFESRVKDWWEAGELPSLLHLCGGNEKELIRIFADVKPEDWVFTSHRAHYHCLLKGMPEEQLEHFIRNDLSMFAFSREHRIYQSAILGGTCGIAVGVAKAIKDAGGTEHVWCFLGDGAVENGSMYEAALYAAGHELPVTFIIENNDRQVDTDMLTRRGPRHNVVDFYAPNIREYFYTPTWPHAGSGSKTHIDFKRLHPL